MMYAVYTIPDGWGERRTAISTWPCGLAGARRLGGPFDTIDDAWRSLRRYEARAEDVARRVELALENDWDYPPRYLDIISKEGLI